MDKFDIIKEKYYQGLVKIEHLTKELEHKDKILALKDEMIGFLQAERDRLMNLQSNEALDGPVEAHPDQISMKL